MSLKIGLVIIALVFLVWLELHLRIAQLEKKLNPHGDVVSEVQSKA